jgi:hypothetical protein
MAVLSRAIPINFIEELRLVGTKFCDVMTYRST